MISSRKNDDAFTIVELMWSILLVVILLTSVFGALRVGLRGSLLTNKTTQFVDSGTTAARVMQKYIRQAVILNSTDNNYLRVSVEKSSEENSFNIIEFYIDGDKLYQKINNSNPILLAENVKNNQLGIPLFTYYREGGHEIADPTLRKSLTRSIRIMIIIDDNLTKEPPRVTVSETVFLRNFNI